LALQFLIILSVFICVNPCPIQSGEMPEMAEGARLEIVCPAKSGTVGSNPTLSATNSKDIGHGYAQICGIKIKKPQKRIPNENGEEGLLGILILGPGVRFEEIIICVDLCKSVSELIL
jgi:hypothetical protein